TGWAVEQTKIRSLRSKEVAVLDCYPADSPDFDPVVPPGVVRHDKHYDFAGRLIGETLFDGSRVRHVHAGPFTRFYDPDATEALAADPDAAASRTSRTDAWGRVVSVAEHAGGASPTERRRYDALGQIVGLVDATGTAALTSVHDGWGNRIRVDSIDAGTTRFVFNGDNLEVLRIDADGRTVAQPRDQRGRVLEIRHGSQVQEVFSYDAGFGDNLVGRLARVSGPSGTVEYSYDPDGNPTLLTRSFPGDPVSYPVGFSYDHQGAVRSVSYPDGSTVAYGRDDQGLLTSISGVVNDIEYGPHGQRVRIRYANGLETRRELRPGDHLLSELQTVVVEAGPGRPSVGTRYQHLTFNLDAVGRVRAIDDQSTVTGKVRNNQTFGYDNRNRLLFATGTGPGGTSYRFDYAYDDAGNLVDAETFTGMQYDGGAGPQRRPNQLVRRGGATSREYRYDRSGNLIHDPELGDLEYDPRHRLIRVVRPNGDVVAYAYDHHNRRITTSVTSGGSTRVRHEVEGVYIVEAGSTTRVVFDEDRRLALLPSSGNGLLHHLDRLGNINVISNLTDGAFAGGNEYTPFGTLVSSITIEPAFAWGGALLTDGLDIVLLGDRWYRPALGRFLTADSYLLVHQDKIPGLHGGSNLYLYALNNPANFSDPTGRLAFLVVLLIAAIVGAVIGAIGAAVNGVDTWDEFLLWVIGGAIGGMLAVVAWGGIICGVAALFGASVAFSAAATAGLVIFAIAGTLGAILTPVLDATDSPVAWFFSFLIKWVQSPVTTTVGLVAAIVVGIAQGSVDFRRGMLFIEVGAGGGALTLGGVAWTQSGRFNPDGTVPDDLARHESQHSRTVAAIGELGFYFTYVTVGAIWGAAQGGSWNDLNAAGCGNPFEKQAHTFTNDPTNAVSASSLLAGQHW
ncbi:MAG: RHS repeat domain-containing protein, partial [Nocardioides sp.]